MKVNKCPCCGAHLNVSSLKKSGVCEYCGSPLELENETTKEPTNKPSTINPALEKYLQKGTNSSNIIPPRPKLNVGLAILLCLCYLIFGIIYIAYVGAQQNKWDEKYGKK